jgi:uncharacterized membrane protein YfcA
MYFVALALSVLVGVSLGMLGGGGSILTTPILVYVLGLPADEAIATSLVVVGMTSAGATVGHARRGDVEWRTGLAFGGAGMVGAYLGGRLGDLVPANVLLGLFGGFMLVTAAAMFRGRREPPPDAPRRPQWRFATDGIETFFDPRTFTAHLRRLRSRHPRRRW